MRPSKVRFAVPTAPPATIAPELATLSKEPPTGDEWAHEVKLDGYRILVRVDEEEVALLTRNGKDWTAKMPSLAAAAKKLKTTSAVLDGELVALRPDGRSDFQLLQQALGEDETATIYYAFDLLFFEGKDLRALPFLERKAKLERLLKRRKNPVIRYSPHTIGHGERAFEMAREMRLEGIVSKRVDSTYQGRRSPDWLKTKCVGRQEVVIGGWTDPRGVRSAIGALLVGTFAKGELVYAGKVGAGFSESSLRALHDALRPLAVDASPFADPPVGAKAKGVHWVKPKLVAEVDFTEMTRGGRLRHPTFRGLRRDKPARDVVLETPRTGKS